MSGSRKSRLVWERILWIARYFARSVGGAFERYVHEMVRSHTRYYIAQSTNFFTNRKLVHKSTLSA